MSQDSVFLNQMVEQECGGTLKKLIEKTVYNIQLNFVGISDVLGML